LPVAVGNLTNLETLSLFNNEIEGQIPASYYQLKSLKVLLLNSNKLTGKLDKEVSNLSSLETLSLFENKMDGQVPFDLEKLGNLKEMNISYNMFNGLVSKNLSKLDTLNMTMVNEQGVATTLKVSIDKNSAVANDE
jgi:Leucine-rich repeat (LRR) protein